MLIEKLPSAGIANCFQSKLHVHKKIVLGIEINKLKINANVTHCLIHKIFWIPIERGWNKIIHNSSDWKN
jgi:hypothetical protein